MASVNIHKVVVLDNPTAFTNPIQFEISFECVKELNEDLEWKVVYVGSAESDRYDQELDSVLVGPVPVGVSKFVLQVDPPDHTKIPRRDVLGVTVILLTCAYKGREFVRVGYYVNNDVEGGLPASAQAAEEDGDAVMEEEDDDEEDEEEEEEDDEDEEEDEEGDSFQGNQIGFVSKDRPNLQGPALPEGFDMSKVRRSILDASPRITRFAIDWD